MSASDHLNDKQHMSHEHIKQLTTHRDVRQLLGSLVDNEVKFVATAGKNHINLKMVGNGQVTMSKTPSDKRAIHNMRSDIRREIRSSLNPDWDFPDKLEKKAKKEDAQGDE